MLFSKQNVFNKKLQCIASLVVIHAPANEMVAENKKLLVEYLSTIASEIDREKWQTFKIIIGYDYRGILSELPGDIREMIVFDVSTSPCP